MTQNCIPLDYIKKYTDQLRREAEVLDDYLVKNTLMIRADYILDLVEAFRKSK